MAKTGKPARATWRRASLYVRLSKAANPENLSRDGMMADCRATAQAHGLVVVGEHIDDGKSGAIRNRPEFLAWLDDGKSGRADVLVPFHADRISREGVNVAGMLLDVVEGKDSFTGKETGRPVRLLDTKGLDSEDGDAFRWNFVIKAEVARAEREAMRRRQGDSKARLREAGRFTGGPVPFGCRVVEREAEDGSRGRYLDVHGPEAELLRKVADRLIAGESMRSCVTWMTEQNTGRPWSRSTLRKVLTSKATKDHVLSLATQRALTDRWEQNARKPPGRPRRYLVSAGGAVCGSCGSPLILSGKQYRCGSRDLGTACPARVTVQIEHLDDYLADEFVRRWGGAPSTVRTVHVLAGGDVDGAERALEAARAALVVELTQTAIERVKAAQEAYDEAVDAAPTVVNGWRSTGHASVAERWAAVDVHERSEMLRAVLDGPVVVGKATTKGGPYADVAGRVSVPWRSYADGNHHLQRPVAGDWTHRAD